MLKIEKFTDVCMTGGMHYTPIKTIKPIKIPKLKTNTSTRKSALTLVTLPSFRISSEISAEKMYVKN